jgi:hypothetical protein
MLVADSRLGAARPLPPRPRPSHTSPPVHTPTPTLTSLLTVAAELRAGGSSWSKVGETVGRSPETCRQWARRYPDVWNRLYRDAERHLIAEAGAEARTRLRLMLRDADARVALAAAQFLLRARDTQRTREEDAERPDPSRVAAEIAEFVRYLKGLSEAQLATLLNDFLARRDAAAAGADPGAADPPGPQQPQ